MTWHATHPMRMAWTALDSSLGSNTRNGRNWAMLEMDWDGNWKSKPDSIGGGHLTLDMVFSSDSSNQLSVSRSSGDI